MSTKVKLKKEYAGYYTTTIGEHEFEIFGPDPDYKPDTGYEWAVENWELEIEEYFRTLKEVREYLNSLKQAR